MPLRLTLLITLAALAIPAACAAHSAIVGRGGAGRTAPEPMVRYTVSLAAPQTQMVDLSMTIADVTTPTLEVALPVWRPGRYALIDQAGSIREVRASGPGGEPLPIEKTDKTTWRIATGGQREVTVAYRVYANSLADRTRHVDDTHAFLSPSTVFMYAPDRRAQPLSVRIEAPDGWRTATGLEPDPARPGTFLAPNYDVLADSPLEIGLHERIDFDVDGVPHEVAIWSGRRTDGGAPALRMDRERIIRDFSGIVRTQRDIFGSLPYTRFVFLIHAAPGAGGGTEHLNSFIAQTSPAAVEASAGIGDTKSWRNFLGLISHEMFHTWNIKQFRPADLHPYDYARENYTRLLWLIEGTTSYYDDLCLVRAGILPPDDYLGMLAGSFASERDRPGGAVQSLEESSFDAWIKFNRPSPDAVNSTVSFYSKGALASLLLDLELRRRTVNHVSLDDAMRELYRRFPLSGRGYTTGDVIATLNELSGADLSPLHRDHIAGSAPMPLAEAFTAVGLELVFEPERDDPKAAAKGAAGANIEDGDGDSASPGGPPKSNAYLGLNLADRDGRAVVTSTLSDGPAYAAGLTADDEVLAIDGLRLTSAGDLGARLKRHAPGDAIRVTYFRRDELREVMITLVSKPAGAWKLRRLKDATEAQKAAYRTWLGQDWPA